MPTLADESGQEAQKKFNRLMGMFGRELLRLLMKKVGESHDAYSTRSEMRQINGEGFSALKFKSPAAAHAAMEKVSDLHKGMPMQQSGRYLIVPNSMKKTIKQELKNQGQECESISEDELKRAAEQEAAQDAAGLDVSPEAQAVCDAHAQDGREWTAVKVRDSETGEPDLAKAEYCKNLFQENGIDCEVAPDGSICFPRDETHNMISALENDGFDVIRGDDGDGPNLKEAEPEIAGQAVDAADKDVAEHAIADEEKDSSQKDAAEKDVSDKEEKASEELGTEGPEGSEELGPDGDPARDDELVEESMAAQRREDPGNTQTTADYRQSRPNTGDMDKSTPWGDQCDPAGAGDRDGDGIRDAAEDRDGDGIEDDDEYKSPEDYPDDFVPEPEYRGADQTQEEYIDTAKYRNSVGDVDASRSVSLQQETR